MDILNNVKQIPEIIKLYPTLAASASFFQPGLGQILCGRLGRGLFFLLPSVVRIIIDLLDVSFFGSGISRQVGIEIISLTYLIVRIWAVYDAYKITSQPDQELKIPPIIIRNPVLAAGASFYRSGLGQILLGKLSRGIILLFPNFIFQTVRNLNYISLFLWNTPRNTFALVNTWSQMLNAIVDIVITIWAVYDSYTLAQRSGLTDER